mmetsp:Transcript_21232/g.56705  ORF Transcript_21232/g.56705 Transcript_21232/m.56705 type:complete len:262 (-) Transcript_21232:30-815(-)
MASRLMNLALRNDHEQLPSGSFRRGLGRLLENKVFDAVILCLVVCDLVVTLVAFAVDENLLCLSGTEVTASHECLRFIDSGTRHLELSQPFYIDWVHGASPLEFARAGQALAKPAQVLTCLGRHDEKTEWILERCKITSLAILSFFCVELFARILVAPRKFFLNCFPVLDLSITVVSFLLLIFDDVAVQNGTVEASVFLLVFLRAWRVVRILFREIVEDSQVDKYKAMARSARARALALERLVPDAGRLAGLPVILEDGEG